MLAAILFYSEETRFRPHTLVHDVMVPRFDIHMLPVLGKEDDLATGNVFGSF